MGMHAQHRLVTATESIAARLGDADATAIVPALDDAGILDGLQEIADARKALDLLTAVFTAEVDVRSARELGYTGLAQRTGRRTGTDLVQRVTGQARTDVVKAVRTVRDLTAAQPIPPVLGGETGVSPLVDPPWFIPLTDALTSTVLSREQFDAIRRGLGEPPEDRYPNLEQGFLTGAWREAAIALIGEATDRGVEDLAAAARLARDTLDPVGTAMRFEERYANRSFSMWIDENGQHNARIRFDDAAAAWVRTILGAALRPRRGPRFVAAESSGDDSASGEDSAGDTRSNEQLQHDTILAVLRTGAAADPTQAFGDRQPGVRIITTADTLHDRDEHGHLMGTGALEVTGQVIPAGVLETYLCDTGTCQITVDAFGTPLDVGREKRLFTRKQRIAIAARDGGCLWCGADPSRCEVHHIDHWYDHHGRTDTADGVDLCTNCHLRLHNQHWRITRPGRTYWLNAPPGRDGQPSAPPRELKPRSLLRFRIPPAA